MTTDLERDQARVAAERAAGATKVVSAHGNHTACRGCGVDGHGAPAHAPLPPSAAAHWVNCAGWLKMSRLFPAREDTPASLEGTASHWVLSEAFANRIVPVGTLAPNGIAVTQEMHDGAELFMSNIPDEVMTSGGSIHVEERTGSQSIHADVWGTPDAWWIRDNVLHVADYKFGKGFVDEFSNWQLICYIAEVLAAHHGALDDINIEIIICQPRCYSQDSSWRVWRTSEPELRPFIKILRDAAIAAQDPDARCTSGSHCAHCQAIVHCPASQQAVSHAMHVTATADPSNMPLEAMGLMRGMIGDARDILKAMADGMDIELEASIRAGKSVSGWAMMPGKGKTDWNVSVGEVVALGDMFGVALRKDAAMTPIQARKEFTKAGIDPALVDGYSASTTGALKLVKSEVGNFGRIFG
jgi:hypothetical protein